MDNVEFAGLGDADATNQRFKFLIELGKRALVSCFIYRRSTGSSPIPN